MVEVTKNLKALAILDRSDSFGGLGGPLFSEVRSSLYESLQKPKMLNYIYGLGGRDTSLENIRKVFDDLSEVVISGKVKNLINYLGVRE